MYVVISHAYAHSSALYEETTVLESSKDSFLRYMYWKCYVNGKKFIEI